MMRTPHPLVPRGFSQRARRNAAVVRVGLGVGIVLLLVVAAPRVAEPSALALFQAVRDLGPISGWRCANSAVYVYDPRHDSADSTLLSDPPEAVRR